MYGMQNADFAVKIIIIYSIIYLFIILWSHAYNHAFVVCARNVVSCRCASAAVPAYCDSHPTEVSMNNIVRLVGERQV